VFALSGLLSVIELSFCMDPEGLVGLMVVSVPVLGLAELLGLVPVVS
jgi:hypothetical protein